METVKLYWGHDWDDAGSHFHTSSVRLDDGDCRGAPHGNARRLSGGAASDGDGGYDSTSMTMSGATLRNIGLDMQFTSEPQNTAALAVGLGTLALLWERRLR